MFDIKNGMVSNLNSKSNVDTMRGIIPFILLIFEKTYTEYLTLS